MRPRYYHKHPREFANECIIVRVDNPDIAQFAEAHGYERLTRKEAIQHIAWMNAENRAWGSNAPGIHYDADALTDPTHPDHGDYTISEYR